MQWLLAGMVIHEASNNGVGDHSAVSFSGSFSAIGGAQWRIGLGDHGLVG